MTQRTKTMLKNQRDKIVSLERELSNARQRLDGFDHLRVFILDIIRDDVEMIARETVDEAVDELQVSR